MLKASIERGDLKPGEVLPGRLELCRLLGTNRPAVDRAIAELVKEGWLISIKGKGTFVADQQMRERASVLTFAVIWFESSAPQTQDNIYWGPLLRGISCAAADLEIRLLFHYCPPDHIGDFVKTTRVDGVIALAPYVAHEPFLRAMWQARIPFVATSCSFSDENLPCVDTDNFAGVRQALEHLWSLGHRQIAIVNLALSGCDPLRRWEAFQQFMDEKGMLLKPYWAILHPAFPCGSPETAVQWMSHLLSHISLPTAIFGATYDMALITLQALRRCGVTVPQEVSLVGFDDPASAAFLDPPLTTVRQPVEQLGRRAVQKLYESLQKGVRPEGTELLQPELVVRLSTAPPKEEATPNDLA
jgi:DNA-binding LacI/PurR family transcriptional regulator